MAKAEGSGSGGQSNSGSKGRKYGRSKKKCERYAAEHRRTRNNPARKRRENEQAPHLGHRRSQESLARVADGRKRRKSEAKRAAEVEKDASQFSS